MKTPQEMLLETARSLTPAERQNRLMRIGDREVALAMTYMGDGDRAFLLSCVGAQKAARIRDEITLQSRLAVSHRDYLAAVAHVRGCLTTPSKPAVMGSYIRPRGRTGPR